MDLQRDAGMINNRVFETLACGAPLVQEDFPSLRAALLGDGGDGGDAAADDPEASNLFLVRAPGDVARAAATLGARDAAARRAAALAGRRVVTEGHTCERADARTERARGEARASLSLRRVNVSGRARVSRARAGARAARIRVSSPPSPS